MNWFVFSINWKIAFQFEFEEFDLKLIVVIKGNKVVTINLGQKVYFKVGKQSKGPDMTIFQNSHTSTDEFLQKSVLLISNTVVFGNFLDKRRVRLVNHKLVCLKQNIIPN